MNSNFPFNNKHSQLWSDWSRAGKSVEPIDPDAVYSNATLARLFSFGVAEGCYEAWLGLNFEGPRAGDVCMCGHPELTHASTGLCQTGHRVCFCRTYVSAFCVEDIRYFFHETLGPAQAHALTKGLARVAAFSQKTIQLNPLDCSSSNCGSLLDVWPARLRSFNALALGPNKEEKHKYLCERCISQKLQSKGKK